MTNTSVSRSLLQSQLHPGAAAAGGGDGGGGGGNSSDADSSDGDSNWDKSLNDTTDKKETDGEWFDDTMNEILSDITSMFCTDDEEPNRET